MHGTNLTPCIDDMTLKPYCIASHLTFSAKVIPTQYLLQDWELNKPVHEKKNKTAVVRFRYFALKQLVAAFKRTTWESVGLRCSPPPPPRPPMLFHLFTIWMVYDVFLGRECRVSCGGQWHERKQGSQTDVCGGVGCERACFAKWSKS